MPARRRAFISDMNNAFEECACREYNALGFKYFALVCDDAAHPSVFDNKILNGKRFDGQILRCAKFSLHRSFVEAAVALCARPLYGRAF